AKSPLKSTLASCFYPHSFSMPRWVNFCLDLPILRKTEREGDDGEDGMVR
ncbi:hypothetical protein M2103_002704, partial [Ereboglobus sp. PH5-5]|nr:hypothetical protein [Ereboglobus sp. PH5-5]